MFGDTHGNVVHLFERDCSLQRRHQKVIEEAPAPGMDAATREPRSATPPCGPPRRWTTWAPARSSSSPTRPTGLRADRIWFMEMNTRLQVEHPVTEAITGLDLVEWQLRVASGEPLPLAQDQIAMTGHADRGAALRRGPGQGFPAVDRAADRLLHLPDAGVRVDSGVEEGGEISPFYDPMIAKLIAHAPTPRGRAVAACRRLRRRRGLAGEDQRRLPGAAARASRTSVAGEVDTGFIEARLEALTAKPEPSAFLLTEAASALAAPDDGDALDAPAR